MKALLASAKEVTTGAVAWGLAAVGTVLTIVTLVQLLRGKSGWIWAFFLMLALAVLLFRAFHGKRGELTEAQKEIVVLSEPPPKLDGEGPNLQFGPPTRIRANLLHPDVEVEALNVEVLAVPVWNSPAHEKEAPALDVHVRADVTYPSSGIQNNWIPTWLEDLPHHAFKWASPGPREVTLPSNGRKCWVVVMAIFPGQSECREWTRQGVGRVIADEFERDDNYWLRLLVNSSNGGPRQVGHEIEYQWPHVHIDGGRTFSAWS